MRHAPWIGPTTMNRRLSVALLATLAVVSIAGCSTGSFVHKRPQNPTADAAVTTMWANDIRRIAKDGDWLLTRGYYATSDLITLALGNDISHASIYDAKSRTIIEAVSSGVRELSVEELLQRNHHVIVVRPSGMTDAQRRRSVERARSRLGHPFDHAGMFGFDSKHEVYCSELAWWAWQGRLRTGDDHTIITPTKLLDYGEVVYWSGHRTDPQILDIAVAQQRARTASSRVAAR